MLGIFLLSFSLKKVLKVILPGGIYNRLPDEKRVSGYIYVFVTTAVFALSCTIWQNYLVNIDKYDFIYIKGPVFFYFKEDTFLSLGIDGISLSLIVLTTFIFSICSLLTLQVDKKYNLFLILLLILELFILCSFLVLDFLMFYIFFEAILIPMFLIIGVWGSRTRRIKAANYFFFYAFFGSLFMLIAIFIIYWNVGSTNWYDAYVFNFNLELQKILWIFFFLGFAIKIPLWPFHIWLPEAHVEAPTIGSIILAGLLLKLGGYGFLRFVLPIFTDATIYFLPLAWTLCIVGIVYASLTTIRQIDMKRIIAYSSVAHMSYGMLGIFSLTYHGVLGGMLLMIGHGLVSSALFLLVGILYDIYGTRLIKYYGGLNTVMPFFSIFFFFFTFANIGLPGLCIFPGEFFVTVGIFSISSFCGLLGALAGVFTVAYMVLLFNRVVFGSLKTQYIKKFKDISGRDFLILFLLSYLTLLFGLCPQVIIEMMEFSILKTLKFSELKRK